MQRPAENKQEVLTRDQRLARRAEYTTALEKIRDEAVEADRFGLSHDEKRYLAVIIRMLIYLLAHMDNMVTLDECYTFPFTDLPYGHEACIHLENYCTGSRKYKGDECEDAILSSLHETFLTAYNNVKYISKEHVKMFCSKLGGAACIDARTRYAFDYGLKFGSTTPFTDLFALTQQKIPAKKQGNYCWSAASLIEHAWEKSFLADKGENAIVTADGHIHFEAFGIAKPQPNKQDEKPSLSFGMVDSYLRKSNSKPTLIDLIEVASSFPFKNVLRKENFIGLILSLPEFKNKDLLPPIDYLKFKDKKVEIQIETAHKALRAKLNDFFINHFATLVNLMDRGFLNQDKFNHLLKYIFPKVIIDAWQKNLLSTLERLQRSPELTLTLIYNCLLERLKENKDDLKSFFMATNGSMTFMHYLVETNQPDFIRMGLELGKACGLDLTQQIAQNGDTPIMHAARHNKIVALQTLIPNLGGEIKLTPEERLTLGKATLIAAENQQWDAVKILATSKPDFSLYNEAHNSVLDYVAFHQRIDLIDILLENGADINQVEVGDNAVKETTLEKYLANSISHFHADTLRTLLIAKDMDLTKNNQGINALKNAMKHRKNFDPLYLLLSQPELSIEAALESDNQYFYNFPVHYCILNLFSLILRLFDTDHNSSKPIELPSNHWSHLNKLLSLYTSTRQTDPETSDVAYWVANALASIHDNFLSITRIVKLSFASDQLELTLTKYNRLYLIMQQSTRFGTNKLLQALRASAKSLFDTAYAEEQDLAKKVFMLNLAEKAKIFSQPRDRITFFKSTTSTQNNLQAMRIELEKTIKADSDGPGVKPN